MIGSKMRLLIKRVLSILLPLLLYAILLWLPLPKQFGLILRYGFDLTLLVVATILYFTYRQPDWIGDTLGLSLTLLLFALPLSGLWTNGSGEMHVLGGLVLFSDSSLYYNEAVSLLEGSMFSSIAARRPLFSGLFAALLGVTDRNLQAALAILVAINALSCYLAAREVQRTHGAAMGTFLMMLLFLFYRRFIGTPDTENLGVAMGALGFAMLWRGGHTRQKTIILTGILLVTLGLNARAGTFLVLPLLVLWAAWLFRERARLSKPLLGLGLLTVFIGFLLNFALFQLLASRNSVMFSNFSQTLYGLAVGGKGWKQIYEDYPEVGTLPEPESSRRIYELAWLAFRDDPSGLSKGIYQAWAGFFSIRDESVFGFISGGDLVFYDAVNTRNRILYTIVRIFMYVLSVLGLVECFRARRDANHSLVMVTITGNLLSVPFLPPLDAGLMRVYATTIPMLVALPMLGLAFLSRKQKWQTPIRKGKIFTHPMASTYMGIVLVCLTIFGPIFFKISSHPPQFSKIKCLPGERDKYVRISPGSYINIVDDDIIRQTRLPNIRQSDFLASIRDFPYREYILELGQVNVPAMILNVINLDNGEYFWLVADSRMIPKELGIVGVCGEWDPSMLAKGIGFFHVASVQKDIQP